MTDSAFDSQQVHQIIVRKNIRKGAELSDAYLLMIVLAATIASYGLFARVCFIGGSWFTGFRWISRTTGLPLLTYDRRNAVNILILSVLASSLNRTVDQRFYETSTRFTLEQEIIRTIVRGPNSPTAAMPPRAPNRITGIGASTPRPNIEGFRILSAEPAMRV